MDSSELFFGFQSYTVPPSVYRYDLNTGTELLWAKVDAPSIDPAAFEVQQVWYNSKDGTRVPMFVVSKKGLEKNGKNPVLLTGYGGFNVSETPNFSRSMYLWMEHGGIYASPTSAAVPSSAKTGIAPGCSRRSRTCSTTSSPPANI